MRYSNFFKVALVATTFFSSSSNLFAGKGDEAVQSESASAVSIPPKLPIEVQLAVDYSKFSLELMQWDRDQKEKAVTAAPVAVPGLEDETREQAALRILLSMADSEKHTPLHQALINRNAGFTRLFLAPLGDEANSPKLVIQNRRSLLNLATIEYLYCSPIADAIFEILITLRESQYQFKNRGIKHFPRFGEQMRERCASLTFKKEYSAYQYVAWAILLGADKDDISIHLSHSDSRDPDKKLHHALATAYKDLCEKGLGHLIDINESVQNGIASLGKINFNDLQKHSAEMRQKKSQTQQLTEALERISKK